MRVGQAYLRKPRIVQQMVRSPGYARHYPQTHNEEKLQMVLVDTQHKLRRLLQVDIIFVILSSTESCFMRMMGLW